MFSKDNQKQKNDGDVLQGLKAFSYHRVFFLRMALLYTWQS